MNRVLISLLFVGCAADAADDGSSAGDGKADGHDHHVDLPLYLRCDQVKKTSTDVWLDHHLFAVDREVDGYYKGTYKRYAAAHDPTTNKDVKAAKGVGLVSLSGSEAEGEFYVNGVAMPRAGDGFRVVDIPNFIFGGVISISAEKRVNIIQGSDLMYQSASKPVKCRKVTAAEATAFTLD